MPFFRGCKTKKEKPLQVSNLPPRMKGKKCAASKKRAAPSASRGAAGSLAVEAALSLWIFILFVICLMMPMEFVRVSLRVQMALEEELRVRCAPSSSEADITTRMADILKEGGIPGGQLYLEPSVWGWLDTSCVAGGRSGMLINWVEDGTRVELDAGYYVQIPFSIAGTRRFYIKNSCSGRLWTGLSLADTSGGSGGEEGADKVLVYVTPYGQAFHWYRDCKSLDVEVWPIPREELEAARNGDGSKYYPCRYCCDGKSEDSVWITRYGVRYHEDRMCSRLSRTVLEIPLGETDGRHPCEICRARKEDEE